MRYEHIRYVAIRVGLYRTSTELTFMHEFHAHDLGPDAPAAGAPQSARLLDKHAAVGGVRPHEAFVRVRVRPVRQCVDTPLFMPLSHAPILTLCTILIINLLLH